MGPADLSASLGVMDTGHPKVIEYIQRVVDAARRRGLPSGTHDPLGKILTKASATDEEITTAEFERETG